MVPATFATVILTALAYILRIGSRQEIEYDLAKFEQEQNSKRQEQTFDFIIVGAGTSGCVLARRLSEKYTVLLLEAGGRPPAEVSVPAFYEYVTDSPDINFFYKSIPQPKLGNRIISKTMGKMLGGTGSHNALVYNRGCSRDYDNWANITGDSSWKYKNLLKFFKKAEKYEGIFPLNHQHGNSGPIVITTSTRPIYPVWKEAAAELNYKVVDPNGPQEEGFTPSDVMKKNGRRVSTYTAYIQPIVNERNSLKIIEFASVEKINFSGKKATGVTYLKHGVEFTATASKEVIISAGVWASPILLFKSGIGPTEMLSEAQITSIADLPVGKNMQDHPGVLLGPFTVTDTSKLSNINNNLTKEVFEKYLKGETEHVLSETGLGPQAFFVSSSAKNRGENDWPDIQFFHVGTNFGGPSSESPPNQFNVAILVGRPEFNEKFLGNVKLNIKEYRKGAKDNVKLAHIDYKYLKSKQDQDVLREGIKIAMEVFSTEAFKKIGTKFSPTSNCSDKFGVGSDEYWDCYVEQTGTSWWHTAGTCRMGHKNQNSVVDSKLRVHGFKGLRIVDASIMPQVVNANTNAACVVIAEKASDDILNEYESTIKFKSFF